MFARQKNKLSFRGLAHESLSKVSRLKFKLVFTVFWFFLWASSSAANGAGQMRVPGADIVELDKRASQLMQQLEMVGLSLAVVEDGEITFSKGYGEVERDSNELVNADTVFRWASVSKGVAAATILSLQADGHFELAEPATQHAQSLKLPPNEIDVSIEDILSHRVGIVRNAYDRRIEDGQAAKRVRGALENLKYLCEPGTCHTYQNVAFDASAEIIEGITGLPYKSVVQERIFAPLDMDTASVTLAGLKRSKSWARPHGRHGSRISRVKENYYRVPAAAGINSSVKDLAKWMIAQMPIPAEADILAGAPDLPDLKIADIELSDKRSDIELIAMASIEQDIAEKYSAEQIANLPLISHDIIEQMQKPRVDTPRERRFMRRKYRALTNAQYGLGWRVYDYAGHRVIGHRGGVQGYRALVLFDPEKRSGIAMMWNSPHSRPIGLQLEFMDQIYGLPKRDWLRLNRKI